MLKKILILSVLFYCINTYAGIEDDSLKTVESYIHKRKRAALFSTFIPGSGQIYNEIGYRKIANKKHRAWWKVPIIYGGLGACGYFFYQNNKFANLTKKEWLFQTENPGLFLDERFANYPSDPTGETPPNSLINGYTGLDGASHYGYDFYAKRRDIFIFAFIGVWALNIIESYVDAHFVSFDVSEDLSLSWRPTLLDNRQPGINLQLNFK